MSLRDFSKKNVVTIGPKVSVLEAAKLMKREQMGCLVVVQGLNGTKRPVGILTDRDIVRLIAANDVDPEAVNVEDIMSPDLKYLKEDTDLHEAIRKMREAGVRRMPVLGKDGALVGIISFDDFFELLAKEMSALAQVSGEQRKKEAKKALIA